MSTFTAEWETPEFDSVPSLAENAVWRLPGCDDTVIRKVFQETYRDFCRRSATLRTWRKVELKDGEIHYPISPVLSAEIDCVTQVLRDGRFAMPQWQNSGVPLRLLRPYGNSWTVMGDPPILIVPWMEDAEANGEYLMVEAVEIPQIGEERAPTPFLRRWGDAIVDGVLARLLTMNGRPWMDGEKARQHAADYENAVNMAKLRSMRGGPAANAASGVALNMSGMV